jgi:hypothetical protein
MTEMPLAPISFPLPKPMRRAARGLRPPTRVFSDLTFLPFLTASTRRRRREPTQARAPAMSMGSLIASRLARSGHALANRAISQVTPPPPPPAFLLGPWPSSCIFLDWHADLGVDFSCCDVDLIYLSFPLCDLIRLPGLPFTRRLPCSPGSDQWPALSGNLAI